MGGCCLLPPHHNTFRHRVSSVSTHLCLLAAAGAEATNGGGGGDGGAATCLPQEAARMTPDSGVQGPMYGICDRVLSPGCDRLESSEILDALMSLWSRLQHRGSMRRTLGAGHL